MGNLEKAMRRTRREFLKSAAAGVGALLGGCMSFDMPGGNGEVPWKDLKFAHVGGLLISPSGGTWRRRTLAGSVESAMRLADAINSIPGLDFAMFSGDMIANSGPGDAEALRKFLRSLKRRWFAVPGPAESAAGGAVAKEDFHEIVLEAGASACGPFWSAEVARKAWILGIDTGRGEGGSGFVDEDQIEFLRDHIDSNPGDLVLVLCGQPPVAPAGPAEGEEPEWQEGVSNSDEFRFVLEAGENVKMAFSGHLPEGSVRASSGMHIVVTPPSIPGAESFTLVRIKGRRARVSAVAVSGSGSCAETSTQDLDLR